MLRLPHVALSLFLLAPLAQADATVALPLFNLSKDRSVDWVGESAAENIIEALHGEGVVTLDRIDRAEAYQRLALRPAVSLSRASIVKIADELDASHAIFGSFEIVRDPAAKSTVRLVVRVLDLRKLSQSPEFTEVGLLEDLASHQNKIAWKVLTAIVAKPATTETEFLARQPNVRVDAMENYIRGLLAKDEAARHRFFTQAARLDPKYSQPCFQLGLHYWEKADYQHAAQWFQRVARTDPHYMQALYYSGICRHYIAEYAAAESAFAIVAAAVPLNEVFSNLGASQLRQAKLAPAIENFERALEGDPADPDYHFNLAYALWHAKRFDEAADRFRAVLQRIPDDRDATTLLGFCLKRDPPRPGDPKQEGLERIKEEYEETVFRQLKSMLEKK
ncbi:MAG: tetratricopeptide repeat protein [Bryobacterales bacterium]|nr:tetratricopeptide repeat protein [Bryobacterales bacterium]